MHIGVIGAGQLGATLAEWCVESGHDVAITSRHPGMALPPVGISITTPTPQPPQTQEAVPAPVRADPRRRIWTKVPIPGLQSRRPSRDEE